MGAQIEVDVSTGVVHGSGEIDLSVAGDLRGAIEEAYDADVHRPVVIDLRDVTFIDSTGVKELIRPAAEGRAVVLRRPSEAVQRVLELSGLSGSLTIETD